MNRIPGRAIAVVNGTAALHVCLQLAGVESGDEVIVPSLTFVATANAVAYCGGIPHFADVAERTLGIDPGKLRDSLREVAKVENKRCRNRITGRRIRAAVPMHTFGHPVDLESWSLFFGQSDKVRIRLTEGGGNEQTEPEAVLCGV